MPYLADKEFLLQTVDEYFDTVVIQIMHQPVVIEDMQLIRWEKSGEKIIGCFGGRRPQSLSHFCGRGGAVMPVCNIGEWYFAGKKPADSLNSSFVIHNPDRMTDAIRRSKIIQRIVVPLPAFDQVIDSVDALIG